MIPRRRAALLVPATLALALAGGDARAEGALVALVQPRDANALAAGATARLSAELRAAGFSVRVVDAPAGGDARSEVERVEGAFATIAILPIGAGAAADVWIADRITGKTVVRRVDIVDPTQATAASDLAVRSVELLRASLLEIHEHPHARPEVPEEITRFVAPPPVPAAPPIAAPSPPFTPPAILSPPSLPPAPSRPAPPVQPRLRASLEAGAALLASTEGGASPRPLLRIVLDLPLHLALRLTAAPSLTPLTLSAPQGTVEVRQWIAGLDLAYTFASPEARLAPMVALGGGVHALRVDGFAGPAYRSEHNDAASGFVSLGAGLRVRLTDGFAALADVQALVLFPGRTVGAVGAPLAQLGRPAFLPALGLLARF